jgi:four helix bundle protein
MGTGKGEWGTEFEAEKWLVREPTARYGVSQIRDCRDLRVFASARAFVKSIYEATSSFPKEEKFGLTAQLRSAAVSVVANLAEGNGRQHTAEYIQFVSISMGSIRECQALLMVSEDLGFLPSAEAPLLLSEEVVAQLVRLRESLRRLRQPNHG